MLRCPITSFRGHAHGLHFLITFNSSLITFFSLNGSNTLTNCRRPFNGSNSLANHTLAADSYSQLAAQLPKKLDLQPVVAAKTKKVESLLLSTFLGVLCISVVKNYFSSRMCGYNSTSRMERWSVIIIVSRSIPIPKPPLGGIP
jgi:hypothetical protein